MALFSYTPPAYSGIYSLLDPEAEAKFRASFTFPQSLFDLTPEGDAIEPVIQVASADNNALLPLRRKRRLPVYEDGGDDRDNNRPPPSLTDQIREGFSFGLGPVSEEDRQKARAAYAKLDEPQSQDGLLVDANDTPPFGGVDFGQRDERPADVWAIEAGVKDPSLPLNRFVRANRDKQGYFPEETPDYILENLFGSGLPGRPDRQHPDWVDRLYTRKRSETPPGADRVIGAFYTDDQVMVDPNNPDTAQVIDMMVANTGMTRSQALDALVAQDKQNQSGQESSEEKESVLPAPFSYPTTDGLLGKIKNFNPLQALNKYMGEVSDIGRINPIAGGARALMPFLAAAFPTPLSLPFGLLTQFGEDRTPYDYYGKPVTDIKHGRGGMRWLGADIPGGGSYSRVQGRLGPAGAPITVHSPSGLLDTTISEDERGYNITPQMSDIAQQGFEGAFAPYDPEAGIVGDTTGTTVTGEEFDWADFY